MGKILSGAQVAAAINQDTAARAADLRSRGVCPTLAILRVGDRPDDISYEKGAASLCAKLGVAVKRLPLPAAVSQAALLAQLRQAEQDPGIHGLLPLRPLPKPLDDQALAAALSPRLDVDGVTSASLMGVFANTQAGYAPCTAQAVLEILDHFGYQLAGKRVTVIGRSLVVGKPLAMMLLNRNATVTICHSRSVDLAAQARSSEILVAAAGQAALVDEDFVNPGQTVIDVGINFTPQGKLVGDVAFERVEPLVAALTPNPGGVGAVTASVLVRHVVEAAAKTLA